jgi:transcriptional regulator with XRE-family HTH domain
MFIGQRLKEIRESKKLSQGEIEKRSGLLEVYISRVENGHTVPSVATLEKMARALEIPLYECFNEGKNIPEPPKVYSKVVVQLWGDSGPDASELKGLRHSLKRMDEKKRKILLAFNTTARYLRCG